MSTIKIQYVSDYTCPYCYASRVSLLEAIEGYDVEIEWLPYEGTPLSKPQVDSYHDPIRKRNYRRLISPVIKELGLDMKLPPRVIPRPYTHLAAEGHLFANEHGLGEAYDARVLTAYYTEEQDIGNPSVLSSLAQEIGLDQSTFETALSERIYREMLNEIESEVLQSIQPKTIPTILIGDSIRLDGGAYTPAQFRAFLDRASKEQQDITTISGAGCGENGCGF